MKTLLRLTVVACSLVLGVAATGLTAAHAAPRHQALPADGEGLNCSYGNYGSDLGSGIYGMWSGVNCNNSVGVAIETIEIWPNSEYAQSVNGHPGTWYDKKDFSECVAYDSNTSCPLTGWDTTANVSGLWMRPCSNFSVIYGDGDSDEPDVFDSPVYCGVGILMP